jgi:hypothetical protein
MVLSLAPRSCDTAVTSSASLDADDANSIRVPRPPSIYSVTSRMCVHRGNIQAAMKEQKEYNFVKEILTRKVSASSEAAIKQQEDEACEAIFKAWAMSLSKY